MTSNPRNEAVQTWEGSPGAYQLFVEKVDAKWQVFYKDKLILSSSSAHLLFESRLATTYYFPGNEIESALIQKSAFNTFCPFKGNACYWHLLLEEKTIENCIWSYPSPLSECKQIARQIGFWGEDFSFYKDGQKVVPRVFDPLQTHPNPLLNMILQSTGQFSSLENIFQCYVNAMQESGFGLMRVFMILRSLHPQQLGWRIRWDKDSGTSRVGVPHQITSTDDYRDSPLPFVFEGLGGVRERIDPSEKSRFPIINTLAEAGATDYVIMPIRFSDGSIHALSLATEKQGGFKIYELGFVYESLKIMAAWLEIFVVRGNSQNILGAYLGKSTGQKVLNGAVKLGDGESIYSVICYSDLRNSTELISQMEVEAFLSYLNSYMECVAGKIMEFGGEVLRFIGDAIVAIFPLSSRDLGSDENQKILLNSIKAACSAKKELEEQKDNLLSGQQCLEFGIGMHIGEVVYGNIGTESRLEFTVIGKAVNKTARIEGVCKRLSTPILVSQEFKENCPAQFVEQGYHGLRGLQEEVLLFSPKE